MTEPLKITLAGKLYIVEALTLGQLRDLSVGLVAPQPLDPQMAVLDSFNIAVKVIAEALSCVSPELTMEALYKLPISRKEMRDAYDAIMDFSGLVPAKKVAAGEDKPGEEKAEA